MISSKTTARLIPERFRRVWHVAQEIAAHPGQSRLDLAETFHLSERQMQADLNVIRHGMGLPLVRRAGYRFVAPDGLEGALTLAEAHVLVTLLTRARRDLSLPLDAVASATAKVPGLCPPHLRPLFERAIREASTSSPSANGQAFIAVTDAMLRNGWVRLLYPAGDRFFPVAVGHKPVVRPEAIVPFRGAWYVIGECHQARRTLMLRIDTITGASPTVIEAEVRMVARAAS